MITITDEREKKDRIYIFPFFTGAEPKYNVGFILDNLIENKTPYIVAKIGKNRNKVKFCNMKGIDSLDLNLVNDAIVKLQEICKQQEI